MKIFSFFLLFIFLLSISPHVKASERNSDLQKILNAKCTEYEPALEGYSSRQFLYDALDDYKKRHPRRPADLLKRIVKSNADDPNIDCAFGDMGSLLSLYAIYTCERQPERTFGSALDEGISRQLDQIEKEIKGTSYERKAYND